MKLTSAGKRIMYSCKQHRLCGFTLVELLVVISIIALLLAMLMPALQRARESAKTIVCRQNTKQMGVASALYSNDYGDAIVSSDAAYNYPAGSPPSQLHDYMWYDTLMPYIGTKAAAYGTALKWKKGNVQVFKCPSQTDAFALQNGGILYGMDPINCTQFYDPGTSPPPNFKYSWPVNIVKRSSVKQPAIRMHIADSMDQTAKQVSAALKAKYMLRIPVPPNGPITVVLYTRMLGWAIDAPVSDRHKGGSNVLFIDGHTEWMSFGDITPLLTDKSNNPAAWSRKVRLWDYRVISGNGPY